MRQIESITENVIKIYQKSGSETETYLNKAIQLKEVLGSGPIERTYAEESEKLNLERGRKNGLFQRKELF